MRRPATDWRKLCKMGKELSNLCYNKTSNLISKWAKDGKRHFAEEDTRTAGSHVKRCSASCPRDVQTAATQHHHTPVRMADAGGRRQQLLGDLEPPEVSPPRVGATWHGHLGRQVGGFLQKSTGPRHTIPRSLTWEFTPWYLRPTRSCMPTSGAAALIAARTGGSRDALR